MRKKKEKAKTALAVPQTLPQDTGTWTFDGGLDDVPQARVYYALRESVPVLDAAIGKLVRLTGGFSVQCADKAAQRVLDRFARSVPVSGNQVGLSAFISSYFEALLTCGTAVGEIVTDADDEAAALYIPPLSSVSLRRAKNGLDVDILHVDSDGVARAAKEPELLLLSVLTPTPGALYGKSLLQGLPFVSGILMRIFRTIGANWERIGNVRFAVSYKPTSDTLDRTLAKERAQQIAEQWSAAMRDSGGAVKDFVSVGDMSIRVIGADNQVLDSDVPVRQILEQIIAKTGLPPFLLGFSWSSTERMSTQQADLLTSELEAYRRILTPVIEKICHTVLARRGLDQPLDVYWDDITLQDQVELARAELYAAQARTLAAKDGGEE
ncbi:MAG: phage portal protein [Oscillospiraceae bacterium]|jgi:hypothetical protein|nr:phage portal protein [Oscillospiraceae bacterium]